MRDKIRIELSSESRLGWEPFYAVLDLPATAQQIRDAMQKARITGREDMTYQSISFLGFDPLPDLEHIRLDTTTVEELNYLAKRLDSLSDEQFTVYQALFDQRFGDVDSDELLSVKDLINMTYGLDNVMVASNIWPISCSSGTRSEYGLTLNMQKKVLLILRYSATSEKRTFRSSLQLSKISKKA